MTAIRARFASVAAPLLKRVSAAIRRVTDACGLSRSEPEPWSPFADLAKKMAEETRYEERMREENAQCRSGDSKL